MTFKKACQKPYSNKSKKLFRLDDISETKKKPNSVKKKCESPPTYFFVSILYAMTIIMLIVLLSITIKSCFNPSL